MYAVIHTGGKQYRVEEGQRLEVERLDAQPGDELTLKAVLVVDGETVLATPAQLGDAKVTARLVGETKGAKIDGFTYKPKSNNRRRWGHRQKLALIEVVSISSGKPSSRPKKAATAAPPDASADEKPAAKKPAAKKPAKKATAKKPAKKTPAKKKAPAKKTTKGQGRKGG